MHVQSIVIEGDTIVINNFLNIVSTWNSGISFGFFSHFQYANILFIISSLLIIVILVVLFWKSTNTATTLSYFIILAGAIGNLTDRMRSGAVYDFIDFHIDNWHWPAFNIADSMICLGVAILFFGECINEKD